MNYENMVLNHVLNFRLNLKKVRYYWQKVGPKKIEKITKKFFTVIKDVWDLTYKFHSGAPIFSK